MLVLALRKLKRQIIHIKVVAGVNGQFFVWEKETCFKHQTTIIAFLSPQPCAIKHKKIIVELKETHGIMYICVSFFRENIWRLPSNISSWLVAQQVNVVSELLKACAAKESAYCW